MSTEKPLLNQPDIFPTNEVLKATLGKSFAAFEELSAIVAEQGLTLDWQYYNDSKAWLCRVLSKKKNIFWLSVWDGYFCAGFFTVERHLEGIMALGIDHAFTIEKAWGKMIPLLFNISQSEQLPDLLKMIEFKRRAK